MNKSFAIQIRALSWAWIVVFLWGTGLAWGAPWKAGVAKSKITPAEPMWMAGYASRDRPAEGTLTELWAKVLVLQDPQGEKCALITMDLIGIDRGLSQSICESLQRTHGWSRSQIAICCSHTHTGPVVARNLRPMHFEVLDVKQRRQVQNYARQLESTLVRLTAEALGSLEPVELHWNVGRASFAVNRRNNRESDVLRLRAERRLAGPVDHDVPVLVARSGDDVKAVVFGYACHATVLDSYQWSGDYPGFAQMGIERSIAGCTALFWAGCGADQNPLPRRDVELAKTYGQALAESVVEVVNQPMTKITGSLKHHYEEIALPLDTLPTRDELRADTASTNRYEAARARMLLQQIESGKALAASYPYPIAHWRLGDDVRLLFLGGEVVVDYALRIKSEFPGTWIAAYANDVMAYIPSRRVWLEGGYEGVGAMVYYGLPTRWAPHVEQLILKEVRGQLASEDL